VVDLTDGEARNVFLRHSFEPEFFAIARPFLAKGGTLFDIGANFGFCTFGMLHELRGIGIEAHLFEANAQLCDLLRRSCTLHLEFRVSINHACVSDHLGSSFLQIQSEHLGSSFISSSSGHEVPNVMLKEYIEKNHIGRVEFTKLDIEGYEFAALKGAERLLESGELEVIYLEVSDVNAQRQGVTIRESLQLLHDASYQLYFCKESDLGLSDNAHLSVNGTTIPVKKIDNFDFPAYYQSDLLAVHRCCKSAVYVKSAP
jgi:FkbM family methyltransferase